MGEEGQEVSGKGGQDKKVGGMGDGRGSNPTSSRANMNLEVKVLSNLRRPPRLIKTPARSRELRRPSPVCLLLSKDNKRTKRRDGSFISNNIILVFELLKTFNLVVSSYVSVYVLSRLSPCELSQHSLWLPGVVVKC